MIKNKEYNVLNSASEIRLSDNSNFHFAYYQTVEGLQEKLEQLNSKDLFFESCFHQALEEYPPGEMYFRYVLLIENKLPVGLYYFQLKKINLRESLDGSFSKKFSVASWMKKKITGILNFYTLVNGNMLQTGKYGQFIPENVADQLTFEDYQKILDYVVEKLTAEKLAPVAVLLKDYYDHERITHEDCKRYGYNEFSVQPNMRLDIRPEWKTSEDYLSSMKSKYRVRTRRTRKKLNGVFRKELDFDDLKLYEDRMHILYKTIADQASFNLFILDKKYFFSLKKHLKEKIKIIGYFLDGKMVGFYTIIYNYDTLDAHFLGYDSDHNREFHLYHNMLYDLLYEAIEKNKAHLDLSRTAMEIKSSIGADFYPMFLYLKIFNKFLNKFTSRFLKFLTPEIEWEERNPFK